MINLKRHYAGKRSVRDGDQFETLVASYAHKAQMGVIHLPKSGARFVKKGIYKPLPMPCDFVLCHEGQCAFIDAKSVHRPSFQKSLVTPHQITMMTPMWERGCPAGYVVSLEAIDKVFYFNLDVILDLKHGESLNEDNATCLLGTRWNMDLTKIFSGVQLRKPQETSPQPP